MGLPEYEFTFRKTPESCHSINKSTGLLTWLMLPWLLYKVEKQEIKMCFISSKFCASKIIHIWGNERKFYCVSHLISRQHESIMELMFKTEIRKRVHNFKNHQNIFQSYTPFLTVNLKSFILKCFWKSMIFYQMQDKFYINNK